MPNPHPDRHVQATARLLDSVAHLLPQLRAHLAAERVLADGWPDHVSYALEPDTTEPSTPLTGRCGANVPRGDILVACLRPRPCGEHDAPVGLTPVERAAEAGRSNGATRRVPACRRGVRSVTPVRCVNGAGARLTG
jgi:hypothetical protein